MVIALLVGACTGSGTAELPSEVTAAAAVPVGGPSYANPFDAAAAAATETFPNVVDPRVTQRVLIYADETTVDLRVKVEATGFCHWFGVAGSVEDGRIRWRAGPALGCDG